MACAPHMTLAVYSGGSERATTEIDIDVLERLLPSALRQHLVFEVAQDPYSDDRTTVCLDGKPVSGTTIGEIIDAIYVHHAAAREG